jgi:hypothetical protein
VRGRLDPEVGAVLRRAIDAAGEALYGRSADASVSAAQRHADAIGLVAEQALASSSASVRRADRFRVVIHVDADALREDPRNSPGSPDLEPSRRVHADSIGRTGSRPGNGQSAMDGQHVSAETSRRLACDAPRTLTMQDRTGTIRSHTRAIPPAIRRSLDQLDRGCRFPGCGLRFCDAHHVKHWADGGPTRLDNLILLCRRHHRAVHEDGFGVAIDAHGDVFFHTPRGDVLPDAPGSPVLRETLVAKQRDLAITPGTTTPLSNGQRLDLHWTIAVIHRA